MGHIEHMWIKFKWVIWVALTVSTWKTNGSLDYSENFFDKWVTVNTWRQMGYTYWVIVNTWGKKGHSVIVNIEEKWVIVRFRLSDNQMIDKIYTKWSQYYMYSTCMYTSQNHTVVMIYLNILICVSMPYCARVMKHGKKIKTCKFTIDTMEMKKNSYPGHNTTIKAW